MDSKTSAALSSPRTFGQYSEILRAAVADEESLQMGESLQALSHQIEAVTEAWRLPHRDATWLVPHLVALTEALSDHHAMVLDLNRDWSRFLEFKAHLAAVNQFRAQVKQWEQQVGSPGAHAPVHTDFDVSAWRVLGGGALLLNVYEQSSCRLDSRSKAPGSAWSRLVAWFRTRT